jgi:hypothetical protein
MIGMGLFYILSPVDGGTSFEDTAAAYATHLNLVGEIQYLGVPFFVLLISATFAVAWVSRRGAPRLAAAGALLALTGQLAAFPLNQGGDLLAYMTVKNGFDVATMAKLQKALEEQVVAGVASLLFIVGIVIGLLLLGIALWRSKAAPAWMGIALALGGSRIRLCRAMSRQASACSSRQSGSRARAWPCCGCATTISTCRRSARPPSRR